MSYHTQAQAVAATATLQALPSPGPGLAPLLARLQAQLWHGKLVAVGGVAPHFTQVVITSERYLAFPV